MGSPGTWADWSLLPQDLTEIAATPSTSQATHLRTLIAAKNSYILDHPVPISPYCILHTHSLWLISPHVGIELTTSNLDPQTLTHQEARSPLRNPIGRRAVSGKWEMKIVSKMGKMPNNFFKIANGEAGRAFAKFRYFPSKWNCVKYTSCSGRFKNFANARIAFSFSAILKRLPAVLDVIKWFFVFNF